MNTKRTQAESSTSEKTDAYSRSHLSAGSRVTITSGSWKGKSGQVQGLPSSVGGYRVRLDCGLQTVWFENELKPENVEREQRESDCSS